MVTEELLHVGEGISEIYLERWALINFREKWSYSKPTTSLKLLLTKAERKSTCGLNSLQLSHHDPVLFPIKREV